MKSMSAEAEPVGNGSRDFKAPLLCTHDHWNVVGWIMSNQHGIERDENVQLENLRSRAMEIPMSMSDGGSLTHRRRGLADPSTRQARAMQGGRR
jgi:hypothetical protein